jgi:hypothetical protein
MDYARFNYVAQPEDSVKDIYPRVGDYDKWAIEWGYRYFENAKDEIEEKEKLHILTKEKNQNARLRFGTEVSRIDPRYQTEDLSNNAMVASMYGIKNLQRILPNLNQWTRKDGESYAELKIMYGKLVQQYTMYVGHVSKNIGGVYDTPKTYDMPGEVYVPVPKSTQIDALKFMDSYVFQTPMWLLNQTILSMIKPETGIESMKNMQSYALTRILAGDKLLRIIESSAVSKDNMNLSILFNFLSDKIFAELNTKTSIDVYRRNLQRIYISQLEKLMDAKAISYLISNEPGTMYEMEYKPVEITNTDIPGVARYNLSELSRKMK